MSLLERFVERVDFESYEDFKQNFKLKVPKDFNFGFDVVDVYADTEPEREALIWCDDEGNEKHFTFTDIKEKSNRVANMFKGLGIRKDAEEAKKWYKKAADHGHAEAKIRYAILTTKG